MYIDSYSYLQSVNVCFQLHGVERVSILDGGLQRWESLGYPVTDVLPDAKVRKMMWCQSVSVCLYVRNAHKVMTTQ